MKVALGVVAPMLAQGVIRRRPRIVRLAQRLDLDRRGSALMRRLRGRYGEGPLRLSIPGRSVALVLSTGDVERLLREHPGTVCVGDHRETGGAAALPARRRPDHQRGTPDPTPDLQRADASTSTRRCTGRPSRSSRPSRTRSAGTRIDPVLGWPVFSAAFARIARRVTLGESARDDVRLTRELDRLRNAANWAYLRPRQEGLRQRFQRRIDAYVARAEPGSLAGMMAGTPAAAGVAPAGQVPHWLFAFDAAAITTFRTLALLAADPDRAATATAEARHTDGPAELPYLRACVQETLRLWPTTLTVLRESTRDTGWAGRTLPPRTTFLIMSGYFHRDPSMPAPDGFAPEVWLGGADRRGWSVFPFSGGPAKCPGRDLVLLVTTTVLARLLRGNRFAADKPLARRLPGTVDHTSLTVGSPQSKGTPRHERTHHRPAARRRHRRRRRHRT